MHARSDIVGGHFPLKVDEPNYLPRTEIYKNKDKPLHSVENKIFGRKALNHQAKSIHVRVPTYNLSEFPITLYNEYSNELGQLAGFSEIRPERVIKTRPTIISEHDSQIQANVLFDRGLHLKEDMNYLGHWKRDDGTVLTMAPLAIGQLPAGIDLMGSPYGIVAQDESGMNEMHFYDDTYQHGFTGLVFLS